MPRLTLEKLTTRAVPSTFKTTATIMRKTPVADNAGGFYDSYVSAGTYPCHMTRFLIRPAEREPTPYVVAESDWEFTFAKDVVIQQTDRLVCQGRTFEVLGQGISPLAASNHVLTVEIV